MPLIEAELSFFQMQLKGVFGDAVEFLQAALCITSEGFDAIDMMAAGDELVDAALHPEMLVEADVDPAVIAAPAVAVNHAFLRWLYRG